MRVCVLCLPYSLRVGPHPTFYLLPYLLTGSELHRPGLKRLTVDGRDAARQLDDDDLKCCERLLESDVDRSVAVVVGDGEGRRRHWRRRGAAVMDSHLVAETLAVHVARELDPDSSTPRHVGVVGDRGAEDNCRGRLGGNRWSGDFDRFV